ncbi:NifU family protein [Neomegalonema sp.]|uniref:NifU family protein n=1 Tax=Neomegalonema sp. TaxID=2039713 RepID=UPI00262DAE7E|nr:NifU family protein [Neomegalonema sp.]MDD2868755.1 NifU family protein [Neomegalonema sp.]
MFIQTESTPNPATLKFLPGREVLPEGSADFPDAASARRSPLAERLFEIEGVTAAFFGADFITVAKSDDLEWVHVKPAVLGAIMDHFTSGAPILREGATDGHREGAEDGPDSGTIAQIKELLDSRVRPAVAQDGGDITFHGFEKGVVYLHMKGSCAGCPSSTMTLKMGIENLLRHYIPDVLEVRPI